MSSRRVWRKHTSAVLLLLVGLVFLETTGCLESETRPSIDKADLVTIAGIEGLHRERTKNGVNRYISVQSLGDNRYQINDLRAKFNAVFIKLSSRTGDQEEYLAVLNTEGKPFGDRTFYEIVVKSATGFSWGEVTFNWKAASANAARHAIRDEGIVLEESKSGAKLRGSITGSQLRRILNNQDVRAILTTQLHAFLPSNQIEMYDWYAMPSFAIRPGQCLSLKDMIATLESEKQRIIITASIPPTRNLDSRGIDSESGLDRRTLVPLIFTKNDTGERGYIIEFDAPWGTLSRYGCVKHALTKISAPPSFLDEVIFRTDADAARDRCSLGDLNPCVTHEESLAWHSERGWLRLFNGVAQVDDRSNVFDPLVLITLFVDDPFSNGQIMATTRDGLMTAASRITPFEWDEMLTLYGGRVITNRVAQKLRRELAGLPEEEATKYLSAPAGKNVFPGLNIKNVYLVEGAPPLDRLLQGK